MNSEKIQLKEKHNGFSERDIHSKAILNQDKNALLKYKIQKSKLSNADVTSKELQSLKSEFIDMKQEIFEIKNLLHRIIRGLE